MSTSRPPRTQSYTGPARRLRRTRALRLRAEQYRQRGREYTADDAAAAAGRTAIDKARSDAARHRRPGRHQVRLRASRALRAVKAIRRVSSAVAMPFSVTMSGTSPTTRAARRTAPPSAAG